MDRAQVGERTEHQRVAEGFADLLDGFTGLDGTFSVEGFSAQVVRSCVSIFGAVGVGLSLAEPDGWLSVAAASPEPARVLETAAVYYRQGPGPDSFTSKVPIPSTSLRDGRWPHLVSFARVHRFDAACAVPVRDGDRVLGALSFYQFRGCSAPDLVVARAVAKAAGTWLERGRQLQRSLVVAAQLQRALTSRVTIEQAKGMLAERWRVPPEQAFTALRRHARNHNRRLHLVAGEVVAGALEPTHPAT